jgi:hypothetical protein
MGWFPHLQGAMVCMLGHPDQANQGANQTGIRQRKHPRVNTWGVCTYDKS